MPFSLVAFQPASPAQRRPQLATRPNQRPTNFYLAAQSICESSCTAGRILKLRSNHPTEPIIKSTHGRQIPLSPSLSRHDLLADRLSIQEAPAFETWY